MRRDYATLMGMGARCDLCPLRGRGGRPTLSELHGGASVVVVAQAPDEDEEDEGRPLVGDGGRELARALKGAGMRRTHTALTHACACRFPTDPALFLKNLAKQNKEARKLGQEETPTPFECCRPRLLRELAQWEIPNIITLGGYAAQSLIPGKTDATILKTRGHKYDVQLEGRPYKLWPTLHPRFVTRQRRWTPVFDQDIRSAVGWFRGARSFDPPLFVNALIGTDGRNIRDAEGHLIFRVPSVEEVESYLFGTHPAWGGQPPTWQVYDLESDGVETGIARIRCIGVGGPEHVMVVPILTCAPPYSHRYYTREEQSRLYAVFRRWCEHEAIKKVGHFAAVFDRLLMEDEVGAAPSPLIDTVLVHKSVDAELPHTLDFCASMYAIVHNWKLRDHGVNETKDSILWEYCGIDVAMNGRIAGPMLEAALERRQITGPIPGLAELSQHVSRDPCTRDHALQSVGVGLHRVGIHVDQVARLEKERECIGPFVLQREGRPDVVMPKGRIGYWQDRVQRLLGEARVDMAMLAEAGVDEDVDEDDLDDEDELEAFASAADGIGLRMDTFNPGSHVQCRKLFEVWDLPEPNGLGKRDMFTDTGELRTGKAVLQAYMTDRRLLPFQRAVMHAIYMYRTWGKRYGTYARPARMPEPGLLAARHLVGRARERALNKFPRCFLGADGRIHSRWNAGGTLVGRYSSAGPNSQNIPLWFKNVLDVEDGNVMIGADVDQFHLRIIAALWGVASLLETFENPKLCPHTVFAEVVLGDQFRKAPGYLGYGIKPKDKKSLATKFRDMAKTMRYAGAYGASAPTIFRVMRSATDDDGRLQMPNLELDQVRIMHDAWMQAEPEWERAWQRNEDLWRRQGYLESPLLKRRRYFLDEKETDVYNWEILSCEGDIFGEITQRIVDLVPFQRWGPGTGMIAQVHDAVYLEVPKAEAEWVRDAVTSCMEVDIPGWPVKITGAADIGPNMSKVAA